MDEWFKEFMDECGDGGTINGWMVGMDTVGGGMERDGDRDGMRERLRKRWTVEWRDGGRKGWGEG